MAEVSKFFNAVLKDGKYDREYLASDFADYFRKVLSAGLLLDDNEEYGLQVTTVNGLDVNVAPGSALIKGYSYDNTTNKTLTHNLPESDKDRIDRVVLRLDLRNQSRFIKTFVKEGVSDNSPNPPELQRDDYIYELSLAQVRLRANTASISASDVIDERADEELCGIVQSLITVPTSIFQQQFTAWFNDRKKVYEQEMNSWKDNQKQDFESWSSGERNSFDEWFESIKGALKGDIAADLASRMISTEMKLENLQEDAAAHLADDTQHISADERRKLVEQTDYKVYKSNKDSNGIFTTIEYKRSDNTLAVKAVLSGGSSPRYTTRTIEYYDQLGKDVEKTTIRTLSYDFDGVLVSEV